MALTAEEKKELAELEASLPQIENDFNTLKAEYEAKKPTTTPTVPVAQENIERDLEDPAYLKYLKNAALATAQGGVLGGLDEIGAAIVSPFSNKSYRELQKQYESNIKEAEDELGTGSSLAYNILGGILTPATGGPAKKIKGLSKLLKDKTAGQKLKAILTPSKEAIGYGTAAGALSSEADLRDIQGLAADTATGAGAGIVGGIAGNALLGTGNAIATSKTGKTLKRAYELGKEKINLASDEGMAKLSEKLKKELSEPALKVKDSLQSLSKKYKEILDNKIPVKNANSQVDEISPFVNNLRDIYGDIQLANSPATTMEDIVKFKNKDLNILENEIQLLLNKAKSGNLVGQDIKTLEKDLKKMLLTDKSYNVEKQLYSKAADSAKEQLEKLQGYRNINEQYKQIRNPFEGMLNEGAPEELRTTKLNDLGDLDDQISDIYKKFYSLYTGNPDSSGITDFAKSGIRQSFAKELKALPTEVTEQFNLKPDEILNKLNKTLGDAEIFRTVKKDLLGGSPTLRATLGTETPAGMGLIVANKLGNPESVLNIANKMSTTVYKLPFDAVKNIGLRLSTSNNPTAKKYGAALAKAAEDKSRRSLNAVLFTMMQSKDARDIMTPDFIPELFQEGTINNEN